MGWILGQLTPSVLDQKLQLALALYATYWLETSSRAKLLSLILALESLMIYSPRHRIVVEILEKWKREVEGITKESVHSSEESHALDSLKRNSYSRNKILCVDRYVRWF
jgi:hypothetical protein